MLLFAHARRQFDSESVCCYRTISWAWAAIPVSRTRVQERQRGFRVGIIGSFRSRWVVTLCRRHGQPSGSNDLTCSMTVTAC